MVAKGAFVNWLIPPNAKSPMITIIGRALAMAGALALVLPIVLPLSSMGSYSELELRMSLFIVGTLLLGCGIAIERRHFLGYYLYLAGALLSGVAHLAQWDIYNLGLFFIDIGFLAIVLVRKAEFFQKT